MILAGILSLQLPALSVEAVRHLGGHLARDSAVVPALLAAAAAAGYTVWDKHAVNQVAPFTYFYSYTVLVALAYAGRLGQAHQRSAVRRVLVERRSAIVQVALLNTVTYLLVLLALQTGTSSYVVALRQLSVAIGAVLGWHLLGEAFGPGRRLGVALIIGGSVAVALAR